LLPACVPQEQPEPELETVELGAGPTDNLRPDGDIAEAVGVGTFAGQLPSDFPKDLPAPPSSSVEATSVRTVIFGTEDSVAEARTVLLPELARAGWQATADDGFSKNERAITIHFAEDADRTRITYKY